MKRILLLIMPLWVGIIPLHIVAQERVYTLLDWKFKDASQELKLNMSEYKLDFNHPLPYTDMQKEWKVAAELKCGTLGTEQVFVCKEGKATHLLGKNSLFGDISLGYDNMHRQFFVEVIDKNEQPHRLCAGPTVTTGQWYRVSATSHYDAKKDESVLELNVDGTSDMLRYPGKALRHNASLWVLGHGFPSGFPNSLQVREGAIRNLEISGAPLPRVAGQNPLFTDRFTADPAFTVIGNTVYAYVGEDCAGPGGWFNMPRWLCYSSTDMKHWTAHGPVLKAADFPYASPGGSWAGQVVERDGKFYYYVTLDYKNKPEHAIDVAVSDSPTGPFTPARIDGTPLITDDMTPDSHRGNADIDPTVLIDDDGTPWMAWGNGDCYMVRLKKNMIELDGEVKKVPMRNYSEGPWLFKRGNLYYNVYASDAPGVQSEQMAYSTAEQMEGPWTYRGFVSTSANHGFTIHPSVIQFKGKWYYIYHDGSYQLEGAPGGDCRRSVCAENLYFNTDGTMQFVPLTQEGLSEKNDLLSTLRSVEGRLQDKKSQQPTPLKQWCTTQITGGDWLLLEQKDMEFVSSLSADRLLYFFRQRVGLPQPEGCFPYGGWESTDLRGHTLGHYLTTLSLFYFQSGDTEAKKTVDYIVGVLREVQMKGGSGYVSAFGEEMLNRMETDGSGWAPYYTLHKILQGLLDAHRYTGNEMALTIASEMGDYIYLRTTRLQDKELWRHNMDVQEVGGFAEALLNLYQETKHEQHLKAGQFFQQTDKLLPSAGGHDILDDKRTPNFHHANSTIPQFIAAEREYEISGDKTLLLAAVNFWKHVTLHRTYCNGSTGYHEHWNLPPDHIGEELDGQAGETCCTNNLIKLSNDLFRITRQPQYAEYVERATLNHIMGSINPENANFMYFHTQLPGSFKTYGKNTDVFWCCTGTGMENHVRYGQSVFFSDADTLYVSQFFPAQLNWTDKKMIVEQTGDLTHDTFIRIRITKGSGRAVLKIRIPSWCKGFKATCAKQDLHYETRDGYCIISGSWKQGDVISVHLPMHLRLEHLPSQPHIVALYYGPFALAADMGTEGITEDRVNVTDNYFGGYPSYMQPADPIPALTGSRTNLDWIRKTEGKLEFSTPATSDGNSVRFVPLYKTFGIRFTDYMKLND